MRGVLPTPSPHHLVAADTLNATQAATDYNTPSQPSDTAYNTFSDRNDGAI